MQKIESQIKLCLGILLLVSGCQTKRPTSETKPEFTSTKTNINFGVFVKIYDLPEIEAVTLAKAFEEQAQVFKICEAGVDEYHLKFRFEVTKVGRITSHKIQNQVPASKPLSDCFLKHIKDLRFKPTKVDWRGEAIFGRHQGEKPPWLQGLKDKILEK